MESLRNENDQGHGVHLSDGVPIRDPEYYYEDGNCVIKVQERLFKVCVNHLPPTILEFTLTLGGTTTGTQIPTNS